MPVSQRQKERKKHTHTHTQEGGIVSPLSQGEKLSFLYVFALKYFLRKQIFLIFDVTFRETYLEL